MAVKVPQTILREPAVLQRTGLKRTTRKRLQADGRFPKPVPLGDRAVGWVEDEIEAWVGQRIAERDAKVGGAK